MRTLFLDEKNKGLVLKGLAITMVVVVHVLSKFPRSIYTEVGFREITTLIDQWCRLSVPLFVMLSGFGFARKYKNTGVNFWEFIYKQAIKLLPWYVLASLTTMWLFDRTNLSEAVLKIISGRADYHLYYVPMIFQLYLFFPPLLTFMKNWGKLGLAVTLLMQTTYYWWVERASGMNLDYYQYVWGIAFVGYLALGVYLALNFEKWQKSQSKKWILLGIGALGLFVSWQIGLHKIITGVDANRAMRFSYLQVILYGSGAGAGLLLLNWSDRGLMKDVNRVLVWLGKKSYLIFLFHQIVLRLVFGA